MRKKFLYLLMLLISVLTGCEVKSPLIQVPQIDVHPTATNFLLTPSTQTTILIPIPTLEPEKANEAIMRLLQESIDCSAPCFWAIVPGKTTADESRDIFNHLGLNTSKTIYKGLEFSSIDYELTSGLSIRAMLIIKESIVENIQVKISPKEQKSRTQREWLAYSPEILIKRYGQPSRVDFMADWGPRPFFSMQLYFDSDDLIVQYAGPNLIPSEKGPALICPLTAQFESIWLWMGKDPYYPPAKGVELSEVASMTIPEFVELMTEDPNNACFYFDGNVFR